MSLMHSADGRSRWPWVIGIVVLAAIIAGVIVWTSTNSGGGRAAPSSPPAAAGTSSATPSETSSLGTGASDGDEGSAPTGCLGGPANDAAAVLAAQKQAPHTDFGAIEVAAAFERFAFRYPYPSAAEQQKVAAALRASNSPAAYWQVITEQNAGDNPGGSDVPAGTHFTVSTSQGFWTVQPAADGELIVDLSVGYVVDGALSPTKAAANGFYMRWENGAWHIDKGHRADVDKLAAGGTKFTAGC